jgi:AcrR family transcriptional regulator
VNGYERRKQRSKESILRSALELFQAKGIKKVSIGEIAKVSGVDPVTIYNNFGSKEALVRNAIAALMQTHWEKARSIIEGEGPFPARLKQLIDAKIDQAKRSSGELFASALADDPRISEMIAGHYEKEVLPALDAFIRSGQAEGSVKKNISSSTLHVYIEMLLDMLSSRPELLEGGRGLPGLTEELWELFLYGICDGPLRPQR